MRKLYQDLLCSGELARYTSHAFFLRKMTSYCQRKDKPKLRTQAWASHPKKTLDEEPSFGLGSNSGICMDGCLRIKLNMPNLPSAVLLLHQKFLTRARKWGSLFPILQPHG